MSDVGMADTNAMREADVRAIIVKAVTGRTTLAGATSAILALLATDRAAGVGEGWKMVPVEPTEAMIAAWASADAESAGMTDDEANAAWCCADWSAMLAASPAPADASGEVERLREAITQALQCTPRIGSKYVGLAGMTHRPMIEYDCGDPWQILRAALNPTAGVK